MGNTGFDEETKQPKSYQADLVPQLLDTPSTPYISVGGVVSHPFKTFLTMNPFITVVLLLQDAPWVIIGPHSPRRIADMVSSL